MFRVRRRQTAEWNVSEGLAGYLFMMPTILVLGTFVVSPILWAVFLSLHKVQLLGGIDYKFIGWRNFTRIVEDERVWIALIINFFCLIEQRAGAMARSTYGFSRIALNPGQDHPQPYLL